LLQNHLERKLQQLNAFAEKMQICCEKRDSDMMAEGFKVFLLKQFYLRVKGEVVEQAGNQDYRRNFE